MKLSLDLRTALSQTLTPQQIQYLKLLQLPVLQLEQHVRQEIELNPLLDESYDNDNQVNSNEMEGYEPEGSEDFSDKQYDDYNDYDFEHNPQSQIADEADPFEFYKLVWQDDSDFPSKGKAAASDDDDFEPFQIKDNITMLDDLLQQLRMLHLSEEEFILAEQIIGNVDADGYLRRDLEEIVEETNKLIQELNTFKIQDAEKTKTEQVQKNLAKNPAREFAISETAKSIVQNVNNGKSTDLSQKDNKQIELLNPVNLQNAEFVLNKIQNLDPPGIASRSIQECLIAQCKALPKKNAAQKLALEILEKAYELFTMKHFQAIMKLLDVTEDYLKEAIDVIRHLNPKPGNGDLASEMNSVIPDFVVFRDEESNELTITVNDSRLPSLKVNAAYEKIKKESKYRVFNKETREWIRNKYEDAKFLIQAIRQRKSTMLKVMTAIAALQKDFFYQGPSALRPLIYKDVSENTGLDISTVCRIVNGKYVQTEFGTFELKFFFSESLPNEEGEEVSTTVIKQIIKDIVEAEPKGKPYSDDKIAAELKNKGYMVARRTVAKYREQLKIPVARLRKELV